ncbi:E3 SUMO-protein ligase RanBP2 [Schistosoma japonicum]|nr:E3 SUMO-protein ligase RanBP2 [Schistosoma japonicum]KAH8859124.1 E3 SUMO-protein ligase RanBP2 [Schistosoma japonicum]
MRLFVCLDKVASISNSLGMLSRKEQIDKHVYHLLAKCCNLNERKLKALEIAKLYYGVSELTTAKSYVEGYLQSRPDSVPGHILLAKIQEDMEDLSGALATYKSLCSLTTVDKSIAMHACFLAQESHDASDVEFWSDVAKDMFPSEKIAFLLKEKVLTHNGKVPEVLKLLEFQLQKDESDSEVCIRHLNLLYKSGSVEDAFTRCLYCINVGNHVGIASWFHNCLNLFKTVKLTRSETNLPIESLCLVRAVCLMELIRVTSQTSCLPDMYQSLTQLEAVSSELSKFQSESSNILYGFAVIWLNFYGGVYAQRFFMNKCTEATHLVRLFTLLLSNMKPNEADAVDLDSLTWTQMINLINSDTFPENLKFDMSNINANEQKKSDIFEVHGFIEEYLVSSDCLNLVMWICAQKLSLQNLNGEDFTLSIPRLDFLLKSVKQLFPRLQFSCTSPVFGSPSDLQCNSNMTIDQLCQIDIICFMITCFLHISIRSLSKSNSDYTQSLCSYLAFKKTVAGIGTDFLFLPLCLLPAAQLATSTQRSWWSSLIKNKLELGPQNKVDNGNRSFLQCGLNQLRLLFHPTHCLNCEGGSIMIPPLLFRVARSLTDLLSHGSYDQMRNLESWPLHYWCFALNNQIFGVSTEQKTPVIQSHNISFCSGYATSGANRCFSKQWCNRGVLWCLNTLENRFQIDREVSTNYKKLLKFLNRLLDHDSLICGKETYSRITKILVHLSAPHEFTNSEGEVFSEVNPNRNVKSLVSGQIYPEVSRNALLVDEPVVHISNPSVQSSSDSNELSITGVSPVVKIIAPLPISCSVTTKNNSNNPFDETEPGQTDANKNRTPQKTFMLSSPANTPIHSTLMSSENHIHHVGSTLSCSLTEFCKSLQSKTDELLRSSPTSSGDQTTSAYRQDSCLINLISVWQTLVSGLSGQLAETKVELARSRELNEQLSKQLNETSKQLTDAVNKFTEFERNNRIASKSSINLPLPASTNVFETSIRELSNAINELRHWLPEGMAAAACTAVNAHLNPVRPVPLSNSQHQSPNHTEVLIQSNNNTVTVQEKQNSNNAMLSPKSKDDNLEEQSPELYEPNVNFKPVLETLPDLVESKNEDENEQRLFCERARLFHWDKPSDSWKTRGVGDVQILRNLKTARYRLVMRRDQDPKMAIWAAIDYSESPEGIDELFMIQFKTPEVLSNFNKIFLECTSETNVNTCVKPASDTGNKSSKNDIPAVKSLAPMSRVQSTLDKFKPLKTELKSTVSSWECPTCLLYHDPSITVCSACHTAKPGSSLERTTVTTKPTLSMPLFGGILQNTGGFVFGQSKVSESTIPVTTTAAATVISTSTINKPIFSFVATSTKHFTNVFPSISSSTTQQTPITKPFIFSSSTSASGSSLFTSSAPTFSTPLATSVLANEKTSIAPVSATSQTGFTFCFGNTLSKLNEPNKPSTDILTPTHDESYHNNDNDNDKVELLDDSKLTFKPVLEVMPQKIEVLTGEENDEVIFCHRAKLYRWDNNTWHERGVGDLKLLRSTVTGVIRCLMRRDHVLKVCCNHAIGAGMHLKPMNTGGGRAWSWWAIDYSEQSDEANRTTDTDTSDLVGGKRETFAVRFKLTEHSNEFRSLFEEAVQTAENRGNTSHLSETKLSNKEIVDLDQNGDDTDSDVVVVELPLQVSDDQLSRARQLKLPDEFYCFENGHITGESECLTAQEEAEEDALLEAAIKSNADTTAEQSDSDSTVKLTPTSKQNETQVQTSTSSSMYIPQGKGLMSFSTLNDASKDSAPKWGSPTTAPTWSNTCTQLFAKPIKETEQDEEDPSATEHDPHYEPIVPLPKLVETKTGEEGELCIFLRRCRAYRYVDKSWKERGVGEIKVLVRPRTMPTDAQFGPRDIVPSDYKLPDIGRARILMRRDQVLKLCLNHPISCELPVLKPMGNMAGGNSLCWVGEDYSEGSASLETLAVRFKLDKDAEEFRAAVARAQSALNSA